VRGRIVARETARSRKVDCYMEQEPEIVTTVIVPAYNEEEGLPLTLERLQSALRDGFEVIVVDDGSTDRTAEVACRYPCRLFRHPLNRGKGWALKTGLRQARGRNVVWIDADDTYPVEAIPAMATALDTYDLVVCSRACGYDNIPVFNRLGNWLFRTLIRGIYGFQAHDPCTGLYGVRREHLERMRLTAHRFAIEPEVSIKSGRMKLNTLEMPIRYRPRVGATKLNAFRAGFDDLMMILGLLFWRGEPAVHPEETRQRQPGLTAAATQDTSP